ncbi:hypothetical protein [Aminobacter aminovorans]|uniref:Uncharacterized protein n=1 Tax=Aminobacter aminovorans TaxID=83263 RepID=A0ABR6H7J5_AMIAI|nr:hypothetical protein [Aminobacter aminovorans]MBB3706482.1 hypothetical protein [Aminobacter aminovorans]
MVEIVNALKILHFLGRRDRISRYCVQSWSGNKSVIDKMIDLPVAGNTRLQERRDAGPTKDFLKC